MTRRGILAGGNFIIDHVKLIDARPEQDRLAFILSEVVIHFEEGAFVAEKKDGVHCHPSLNLPQGFIAEAMGAGDAFAAGYLHDTHEGWPVAERLKLGVCSAAMCLTPPTPSLGRRKVAECLKLADELGFRD